MSSPGVVRPTGHLQVKGTRGKRAFYALIRDGEGRRQRRLGPAWVKDSGRRTPRGAVKWVTRDGSKPEGYLSPADAEELLAEMLACAPRRRTAPANSRRMTLREACDHWLAWARNDREIKRSSLDDYTNVCNRVCRELGAATAIADLSAKRLQSWIDGFKAERRLSPAEAGRRRAAGADVVLRGGTYVQLTPASSRTRRKYLINLNGIFKRAVKLGAIEHNPVPLVERPGRLRKRSTLKTTQFLRPAQVHALVRAARQNSEQDAAIFLLASFAGLRLGEVLDLRWGAVNFEGSAIHVESSYVQGRSDTPKSGSGRTVPMAGEVSRALARLSQREYLRGASDLVFVGDGLRHVDSNALRKRFYAALERAGLPRIRFHDLRHTFGTVCAAKGIPQTTIKEWMGHSDLATTEIYMAFYPQEEDAAKISAAFAEEATAAALA